MSATGVSAKTVIVFAVPDPPVFDKQQLFISRPGRDWHARRDSGLLLVHIVFWGAIWQLQPGTYIGDGPDNEANPISY